MLLLGMGALEESHSLSHDIVTIPNVSSGRCPSNPPKHPMNLGASITHPHSQKALRQKHLSLCSPVRFYRSLPISSILTCHMEGSRIEATQWRKRLVRKKEEATHWLLFFCGLPYLGRSGKNKSNNFKK